ncbi:MAG: hypothetical protein RDV41_06520 [Planctomycetota bacterium]|nr:hypothetical protein [Planctomycetota bacterium]
MATKLTNYPPFVDSASNLPNRSGIGVSTVIAAVLPLVILACIVALCASCGGTAAGRPEANDEETLRSPKKGDTALNQVLIIDASIPGAVDEPAKLVVRNVTAREVTFLWRPVFYDEGDSQTEYRTEHSCWKELVLPGRGTAELTIQVPHELPVTIGVGFRRK